MRRQKLANILRNFHRTSPHPEADRGDVDAAIDAILRLDAAEEPTKWVDARPYPWSSVVGCGVMLLDARGACVGQLAIRGFDKDEALAVAEQVAAALNARARK
jgi:hypothetical protein